MDRSLANNLSGWLVDVVRKTVRIPITMCVCLSGECYCHHSSLQLKGFLVKYQSALLLVTVGSILKEGWLGWGDGHHLLFVMTISQQQCSAHRLLHWQAGAILFYVPLSIILDLQSQRKMCNRWHLHIKTTPLLPHFSSHNLPILFGVYLIYSPQFQSRGAGQVLSPIYDGEGGLTGLVMCYMLPCCLIWA